MKSSLVVMGACLILTACESKAGTGALAGAGVGALAGGLIGGNAAGALIGGAVGAAAGGLIGAGLDSQDRQKMQSSPDTLNKIDNQQQLSISDVEAMSRNGLSDDVIIAQIQNTKSVFHLSSDQIIELKKAGVSNRVINYMIQTGNN